jgi:hypothetical protein
MRLNKPSASLFDINSYLGPEQKRHRLSFLIGNRKTHQLVLKIAARMCPRIGNSSMRRTPAHWETALLESPCRRTPFASEEGPAGQAAITRFLQNGTRAKSRQDGRSDAMWSWVAGPAICGLHASLRAIRSGRQSSRDAEYLGLALSRGDDVPHAFAEQCSRQG